VVKKRIPPPRGDLSRGIPEALPRARDCLRRAIRVRLKPIVPPLQGWVSVWFPLTWPSATALLDRPVGAHLRTHSPAERQNRLRAPARRHCVFLLRGGEGGPRQAFSSVRRGPDEGSLPARERPMKMFFLLPGEKVAEVRGRMRGLFSSGPAANQECSFILLHNSADKRSEVVSGERRGGGKIKSRVRGPESGLGASSGCATRSPLARHSPLVTHHLPLAIRQWLPVPWICSRIPNPVSRTPVPRHSPLVTVSRRPATGSRERDVGRTAFGPGPALLGPTSGAGLARARCRAEQRSARAQRCGALRPPPVWRERDVGPNSVRPGPSAAGPYVRRRFGASARVGAAEGSRRWRIPAMRFFAGFPTPSSFASTTRRWSLLRACTDGAIPSAGRAAPETSVPFEKVKSGGPLAYHRA